MANGENLSNGMYIVESLRNYISTRSDDEFKNLADSIYNITDFIRDYYPNHRNWFIKKQLPGVINGNERDILFVRDPENLDNIIGMTCIKNTKEEKKLCTLFVSPEFRGKGIGSSLMEEALRLLGTDRPLVTFPNHLKDTMNPFIVKYKWKLIETVPNAYGKGKDELCYNGTLKKRKTMPKKQREDVIVTSMFVTSSDEGILSCPYHVKTIPPLLQNSDFSLLKPDQESRDLWIANGKKDFTNEEELTRYIKTYYFNVLKELNPSVFAKRLNGMVLYGEEPNRLVIAGWLRLLLGEEIEVNDVTFTNGQFEYIESSKNIEQILEAIMKEDKKDMYGYQSLRAVYLYERGLNDKENARLFKTLADEADQEYIDSKKPRNPETQIKEII